MLNNTARELLLQAKRGNTALLIDALYWAGWLAGQVFSYADAALECSSYGTSSKVIRSALNDPLFKRLGRRNALYTLPSPDDVLDMLQLHGCPFTDELEHNDFASLGSYRLALHKEILKNRPNEYSRKLLSGRLGVSRTTTLEYEKKINRAGEYRVYVEPQFSRTLITMRNIGRLPLHKSPVKSQFWLERPRLPNQAPEKAPLVYVQALKWIEAGYQVFLTKQLPNYYQLVAPEIMGGARL